MERVFFNLEPVSSQWEIAYTREHDREAGNIFNPLSERQMVSIDTPIPMSTYNYVPDKNEWRDKSPFDFDAIRWTDDITLGSISLSGGITGIVIAPKLKAIIEKFKLPKHVFYPVNLTNVHSKESKSWFLLYMPEHRLEFINWRDCEFKLEPSYLDKNKVEVEYIGPGVVSSYDDFTALRREYRKQEIKKFLQFHKVAYRVNYDVMWGNPNILVISSRLKEAVVSENIKVYLSEHKEVIIVPNQ